MRAPLIQRAVVRLSICVLFFLQPASSALARSRPGLDLVAQADASSIGWDFLKVIASAAALGIAGVIGALFTRARQRIEKKEISDRAAAAEVRAREIGEIERQTAAEKEEATSRANEAEERARRADDKIEQIERSSAAEKERTKRFAKEAEAELTKKTEEAQTPPATAWTRFFKKEVKASARVAKELAGPSKVIVVASGKGGVGKSTVSLGLLEYYNRFGPALLVDFDMPNRGLTSLLRSKSDNPNLTNTLTELSRFAELPKFRTMFPNSQIAKASNDSSSPPQPPTTDKTKGSSGDAEARLISDFRALAREFTEENDLVRLMEPKTFDGDEIITIANDTAVINRANCLFIPSVRPGELFLSSRVFNAHFTEVFYFIRCLANWALNTDAVRTVILDCHGAHDLFMIGAIHAATDLVVVMTPDPGSFDGTYDLLAFADRLNQETTSVKASIALVINNCRDWEASSVDVITRFYSEDGKSPIKPGLVLGIPADEDVRLVTSRYLLGKASATSLWNAVKILGDFQRRAEPVAPNESQLADDAADTHDAEA